MIEAHEVEKHFEGVAQRFMAPLTDVVELCYPRVVQSIRDAFTSSASPYGANWPPRKIAGDGHPLEIDKGNFLQAATGGGAGHVHTVESSGEGGADLCVGVSLDVIPYARAQALGYAPRNLPARNPFGLNPREEQRCTLIIGDAVERRFDSAAASPASQPVTV